MRRPLTSRVLALLLAGWMVCSLPAALAIEPDNIIISSVEDLQDLSKRCTLDAWSQGKTVTLAADLDLGEAEFTPIPTFGGTFLGQGYTILLTKSSLDFIAALILASSLGVGVPCSALTVLLYQGALTLLAGTLRGVLVGTLLDQLCMVGYGIVLCIGINFFEVVKIKTASLLPALLVPLLYNVPMLLKTL